MTRDELIQHLKGEYLRGPMGHRAEALADFIEASDAERDQAHADWKGAKKASLEAEKAVVDASIAALG